MQRQEIRRIGLSIIQREVNRIAKGPRRERRKLARMLQKVGWAERDKEEIERGNRIERTALEWAKRMIHK